MQYQISLTIHAYRVFLYFLLYNFDQKFSIAIVIFVPIALFLYMMPVSLDAGEQKSLSQEGEASTFYKNNSHIVCHRGVRFNLHICYYVIGSE